MTEPPLVTACITSVVRFWREGSGDGSLWQGHIEHLQSGEGVSCLDLEGVLASIQDLGVMADNLDDRREMGV
jgi:hypothetical protein